VNFGGEPENPQSELPVVIDGLEFEPATDLRTLEGVSGTPTQVGSRTDGKTSGTDHTVLCRTSTYAEDPELEFAVGNGTYVVTLHVAEVYVIRRAIGCSTCTFRTDSSGRGWTRSRRRATTRHSRSRSRTSR
jgi:hypothetical protein